MESIFFSKILVQFGSLLGNLTKIGKFGFYNQ